MNKIKIMINGLPGNMAKVIAGQAILDERFEIVPYSLTGNTNKNKEYKIGSLPIKLIPPAKSSETLLRLKRKKGFFIIIDFTHPSAVNINGELYCKTQIPFIMGTTGGDVKLLEKQVIESSICAIIAPNMAKQVVGFQAMLEFAADNFSDFFKDYTLTAAESHQSQKSGTSGTAEAVIGCFKKLGADFSEKDFQMERDREKQKKEWKIPEEHLDGHGWHTYTLVSRDSNVKFVFTHNVCGRSIYAGGTFAAVVYLENKINSGERGKIFSMVDVLKK